MKALKILCWTLLGIVLTVVAVVSIAMYVVFTPQRLTPVAREAADRFIACPYEIGEVDLTFFSTFPRFGLRADGLLLINPMEGAQNDTVVEAKHFVATVDVKEILDKNNLHVYELILEDAKVNFYIAPDGKTNLSDAFITSPDTTEEDTAAFSLPFDKLKVDGRHIQAHAITFVDAKDTIEASLGETELSAKAESWDDMLLALDAKDVCATLQGERYADSLHLELIAPMAMNLDAMHFALDGARLAVNEFDLRLEGDVTLGDAIDMDMRLETGTWDIESLMAIVPASMTKSIKPDKLKGNIALDATAKGMYSDTQMPVVTLHALKANLWKSQLEAKGVISDIESDMLLDLQLALDANIPDFKAFIPKGMTVVGKTKGTLDAKIRMSDLSEMRLEKGQIAANLNLAGIRYEQDSILAILPRSKAKILIPNAQPSKKQVNWARVDLEADKIDFVMGKTIDAFMDAPVIHAEVANILKDQEIYFATIRVDALDAIYEDIKADLKESELEAFYSGEGKIGAKLKTTSLNGRMGEELIAKTGPLALEVSSRYDEKGENALLKWNPRVKIDLKNGELDLPNRLPERVHITSIEFKYSNREMTIDNSRIELGNSDLNLKGHVRNIGKWFRHEDILQGELEVISDHCDANQLLVWFSDDKGSEETEEEAAKAAAAKDSATVESEPFLVPTDVDLALMTHMREVEIFNQHAKDLKGGIYVKDGTLILDEVGFVCRAAKLQLTAMYRTPRRNHIYTGLDYHMIDVDIDELMTMIPNLEEMVPMLSSFKGAAQFHLAVETYMNSQYKPKMSTLRGAASLTGKDLVVLDGETFSKISKLLLFNKKTENKIDSINAELTIYKNEIDVYPLCVQMDNYMVALGGRHNTNMTFDYDINVLSPIYLGVNVSGTMDDLQIKLAKCKFAQDFKPHWYQKADTQSRELRERIKQSMEKNVRIK